MPLLVHSEVTDPEVDVFDREAEFVERVLKVLARSRSFSLVGLTEWMKVLEGSGRAMHLD